MGYLHIENLYKNKDILKFKECYALEKLHGTSSHVSFDGNNLITFSSGGAIHTEFLKCFDEDKLLKIFKRLFNEKVTIFGEAIGGKIQKMGHTYGKTVKFIVFDVKIGSCWLDVPNAEDVTKKLGLEFVQYIRMSTTMKNIDAERCKESTQAMHNGMGKGKLREGIVLRPLIELTKNNGNRIISKHKNDEFRETKTPRIVSDAELQVIEDAKKIADEWVTVERLNHVLDKLDCDIDVKSTGLVITAMVEDVYREGRDEIIESQNTKKAIANKTVKLFHNKMKEKGLLEREHFTN